MFGRKATFRDPEAPALLAWTHPFMPSGGAQAFSPVRVLDWPVVRVEGPGVVVRDSEEYISTYQPPQLRTVHAPTLAPIYGSGVVAGQWEPSPLTDPYDNASPGIASAKELGKTNFMYE